MVDRRQRQFRTRQWGAEILEPRQMLAAGDALSSSVNVAAGGVGSNHNNLFQDFGSVAALSNGNFVTSWVSRNNNSATPSSADGDGYSALFQVIQQDGTKVVGPVVPYLGLNASGTGRQQMPRVAPLSGGGFAITWNSAGGPGDVYLSSGRGGDVYVRVYDNSGAAVSSATRVNEATADEELPSMILPLSGGGFAIVYRDDNETTGNKDDLFVRAYGADGTARGASVTLGGAGHDALFMDFGSAVALSNGGFAVGWRTRDDGGTPSPDGHDYGGFIQVFDSDGATVAAAQTPYADINGAGTGEQNTPKLAALSGGGFAATWNSTDGPGDVMADGGDTYTRVFGNDGTAVSSTLKVNTATADEELPTAIVGLSGGGYAIVYLDDNENTGNTNDYFIRTFTSAGTAAGAAVRLGGAGHDAFFQDFGDLVALPNGNVAVAWTTRDEGATPSPDGDDYGVFVQVLDASGTTVAAAFNPYADVNASGTGRQSIPKLTAMAGGGFAVTWNSAGGPGDVYLDGSRGGDTYTRVFDNSGAALHATVKVNESEPTGTNDEQLPTAITSAGNGNYVVVYKDDNEETGNEDDYFVRVFEGVPPAPPNAAPTASGVPSDVTVTEDTASNLDLSAVVLADAEDDALTVTLSLSAGSFGTPADGSGNSVVETRVSATSVTLVGSAANINTYLDTASNLTYTGAADASGQDAATLTLSADDGSNTANLGTINLDITAVNDPPTISGLPTDITVTEDTLSNVDLSAVTLADVDGDNVTVTLDIGAGTFAAPADGSSGSVTETLVSSTQITLVGAPAAITTYLDTAANIRYTGASNAAGGDVTTLTLTIDDGVATAVDDTANIDITNVNDAPTASGVPSDVTATEDTLSNIDLSAITLADIDGDSLTVTLNASAGDFATPVDGSGNSVVATRVSATQVTLAGSAANINTYLDTTSNIKYTPASNVSGQDVATLTLTASDSTATPNLGTINVDVTGTNDAPTISGLPSDVTVAEDTLSNVDLSAVTLADIDGDNVTVTLDVAAGTFATPADGSSGSVTETLVSATQITLVGTPAAINTYLDTASNIRYTGANNAVGNDVTTLTLTIDDSTATAVDDTANIDITNVNDAPTASGVPSDVTVTEDTLSNVDLSAIAFADVDGDSLTVTLNASAGDFATPVDGSGNSVVATRVSATQITLAGTAANINTYLDTDSNIKYTPAANVSGQDAATLTLTATDSTATPNLGTINVDVTGTNDAPTITGVPATLSFTEDTRADFSLAPVTVADIDGDALTLTLTASGGTFQATSSGGVVVAGNDTASLTLDGTASAINAYLDVTTNITYAGAADQAGVAAATFTVQIEDPDAASDSGNGQIDITAVNDPPRANQLPSTVLVAAGVASDFDLSAVTIEDPELDNVIVQLAVSSGTLAASNGTGVTVTLTNNNFLQLAGSLTDINNYLDDASQIQYTHSGSGDALFVMLLSDGTDSSVGGSGTISIDNSTPPPARIDLAVTSWLNTEVAGATDSIVWNVEVTNEAGGAVNAAATGVEVAIRLPPKLQTQSHVATNGTLQGNTWTLSEPLAPGGSAVLALVLAKPADETVTAGNTVAPTAFVAAADQTDTDSTPGNQLASEDDQDSSSATWVAPLVAPDATSSPATALPIVRRDGNFVHAVATHGNDVVIVEMGATTHRLEISGHVFEFDATVVDTIYVGGSLGEDYVRVIGTDQNDSGSFFGPRGELISSAYTVKTFSFKETHLIGGGGHDAVRMYGSDAVDTLTVQPGMTQMVTPDHTFYADADRVDVYGRRGADVATLYGSRHADSFLALPDQDHFRSAGKLHVTKGFHVVDVHGAGGADRADLRDTSGDDVFQVTPELAAMRVSQRIRNVHHYDHVTATAQNGGTDTATMAGQTGRGDTLLATPTSVRLAGRTYGSRTATGFGQVTATSDDSLDRATFNQLQATDLFFGRQDLARIERGTDRQIVDGFATLTVEIASGQAQPNKDLDDLDFVLSNELDWA